VPNILGEEISGEEGNRFAASLAVDLLHPEPIFDRYFSIPV
jgi:hypothetical protein